jgi:hypothetical protein
MKTYFEKELELGCLSFYVITHLKKIVWLPTFITYKLEAIAFNWLCFVIGVYINDKEE